MQVPPPPPPRPRFRRVRQQIGIMRPYWEMPSGLASLRVSDFRAPHINSSSREAPIYPQNEYVPSDPYVYQHPERLLDWGIKFHGGEDEDVMSFLHKVEDFVYTRNVSDAELFRCAGEFFEGPALEWYRSVRNIVTNWHQLGSLLMNHFCHHDYDLRLWVDIEHTKQGDRRFFDYWLDISYKFRMMPTFIRKEDRKSMIISNAHEKYDKDVLASLKNELDIIEYCKRIDDEEDGRYKSSIEGKFNPRLECKVCGLTGYPFKKCPGCRPNFSQMKNYN